MTTKITNKNILITGLVLLVAFVYILPLFYGISVSLKTKEQLSSLNQSPLPMKPKTFEYNGKKLEVFLVPINKERTKEMAALQKGRDGCVFIDIDSVSNEKYNWSGQWRTLQKAWEISPKWSNFLTAWKAVNFPQLFKNTLMYAVVSTIGAVFSALFVAYGFARYDFPGKKILFIILIATIVLPSAVTLIPQYTMFYKLGWIGTWLPLIVPHFFGNAFNIFLLRQFIMGIPREMDEAACVDGAGPIRTLFQIILPQAIPSVISVALFHFFFAWNDFFNPLIYLAGKPEKQPITVGLSRFSGMYSTESNLIQAASLLACVVPFAIFFIAQKFFINGVQTSGVEK